MKIGAVVILYNPNEEVVDNILTYANIVDELYVIDNSEGCNKPLLDNSGLSKVGYRYIGLGKNYGIAKALNVGINIAISEKCTWVLTMDQDSGFENNIISIYREYLKNNLSENIGILAPAYLTDRINDQHSNETKILSRVMQSANLVNCQIYQNVGPYEEKLFIDCVDYEYCLRLEKFGYKIVECSAARLNHSPAETKYIKIFKFKYAYGWASPIRYYYQIRNLYYLIRKYKDIYMIALLIYKFSKVLLLFGNKRQYLKYMCEGIYDCRRGIFGEQGDCDEIRKNKCDSSNI